MAETMNPVAAAQYLAKYGWLGKVRVADAKVEMLADGEALGEFQSFAGLPVTGLLDAETVEKMRQPRCGVPDVGRLSSPGAALAAKWRKTGLTYKIAVYVPSLDKSVQDAAVRKAFDSWSEVAGIKFTQTDGVADLLISAGRGAADNFDGPSGTLAWAYLPNGDDRQLTMKFDIDEQWTITGNGIRFVNVAAHEFGHMLGLEHSRIQAALMAPFYSPSIAKPQTNDDIPRIQALYGPPVVTPVPTPTPTLPGGCPTICDIILQLQRGVGRMRRSYIRGDDMTMSKVEQDQVQAATAACANLQWAKILANILGGACPPPAPARTGTCQGLMAQIIDMFCKPTT